MALHRDAIADKQFHEWHLTIDLDWLGWRGCKNDK